MRRPFASVLMARIRAARRRRRYAVRAAQSRTPWPVLAGAVALGSAVGYAALHLLFLLWRPAMG